MSVYYTVRKVLSGRGLSRISLIRYLNKAYENYRRRGATIIKKNGFYFYPDPQGLIRETFHPHEPETMEFIKWHSSFDKTFVDIGAHVGWYSVQMSRIFKKVVSFEPAPKTFGLLTANILINRIKNVEAYPIALSDFQGEQDFHMIGDALGWSSLEKPSKDYRYNFGLGEDKAVYTHKVSVKRLDDYNLENVGVIKIDAEGHDQRVLSGAEETIERCKPVVIWENPKLNKAIREGLKNTGLVPLDRENVAFVPEIHD